MTGMYAAGPAQPRRRLINLLRAMQGVVSIRGDKDTTEMSVRCFVIPARRRWLDPSGCLLTREAGLGDLRAIGGQYRRQTSRTGRKGCAARTAVRRRQGRRRGAARRPDLATPQFPGWRESALPRHLYPVGEVQGGRARHPSERSPAWPTALAARRSVMVVLAPVFFARRNRRPLSGRSPPPSRRFDLASLPGFACYPLTHRAKIGRCSTAPSEERQRVVDAASAPIAAAADQVGECRAITLPLLARFGSAQASIDAIPASPRRRRPSPRLARKRVEHELEGGGLAPATVLGQVSILVLAGAGPAPPR